MYLCSIRVRGNRCDRAADLKRVWLLEKNKMESEIGEYQKTLDEMLTMANLHQDDYGSTIRIQELERRCEIASKQWGIL